MSSEFLKKQQNVPMIYRRHGDTTPKTKGHTLGETKPKVAFRRDFDAPSDLPSQPSLVSPTASNEPFVPSFIKTDKKVLRYESYFLEAVNESDMENFRVRRCNILYYLEDGSMQIVEPKIENSGLPQGNFIKRHKIPKPDTCEIEYFSYKDLRVGQCITCYGRTFRIVNADPFTKNFLSQENIPIGEPEDYPTDSFFTKAAATARDPNAPVFFGKQQNAMKVFMEASLGKFIRPSEHLKQFIDHDRHVLRLYASWDDRSRLYGMKHRYTLHFFLSDNTVEIRENFDRNSGCDPFPKLLNRTRLVKKNGEYYTWQDFMIGQVINVYSRELRILDVDQSTRDWFEQHSIPLSNPIDDSEPIPSRPAFVPPPHTGIGSDEDSLNSCFNLTPKPPRAHPDAFDPTALLFSAVLDTTKPEDTGRHFIISYFVADKSISVMEPPVRNSGIVGGKFLERGRHKKPNGNAYEKTDFYVGAVVPISGNMFILTNVDEATVKHMEAHPETFPKSDANAILESLRQVLKVDEYRTRFTTFVESIPSGASFNELKALLQEFLPSVVDHQVNTIMRKYVMSNGMMDMTSFAADVLSATAADIHNTMTVRERLSNVARDLTDRQAQVIQAFRLQDGDLSCQLGPQDFTQALQKIKLPAADIKLLCEYFYSNKTQMDYNDCLHELNELIL